MVKNTEKAPHTGHRERMRARFESAGDLSSFSEHEVIEMLLYAFIPRKNTNGLAHDLIAKFDSVEKVLNASVEELESVPGISHQAALGISFIKQMMIYTYKRSAIKMSYENKDMLYSYIKRSFLWEPEEKVRAVLLDGAHQVIDVVLLAVGNFESANINIHDLVRTALNCKCCYMILAHNHPNRECLPSAEDISTTQRLCSQLRTYNIKLLDHLIVTNDRYLSMNDSSMLLFHPND